MMVSLSGRRRSQAPALLTAAAAGLMGLACDQQASAPPNAATVGWDRAQQQAPASDKPVMLAINGLNYTDLPISFFAVGSSGGGNIVVSSPTSGGGKTECCVTWHQGTPLPQPITIEWLRYIDGHDLWCKKTVQITGPVPPKPTAFGVHFTPDGDIQGYPKMKLRLENFDDGRRKETGNVIHDEQAARCSNER